ncbi:MAG: type II toxin-antitoxin system mRNA interferase toxin, RelE/StbE family [Candidatus Pacebacteria bacterium]|nr:type II toxin-antitoxin system mRNA interferase toxin, RelE/StbE family [Candidatus Paceibacterota bacterium]
MIKEIIYLPRFDKQYKKLTTEIQEKTEAKEEIFRKNPFEPSLRTHKLSGPLKDFWVFSINHTHRIIFKFVDRHKVWFYSIGNHDIYE